MRPAGPLNLTSGILLQKPLSVRLRRQRPRYPALPRFRPAITLARLFNAPLDFPRRAAPKRAGPRDPCGETLRKLKAIPAAFLARILHSIARILPLQS